MPDDTVKAGKCENIKDKFSNVINMHSEQWLYLACGGVYIIRRENRLMFPAASMCCAAIFFDVFNLYLFQ